MKKEFRVKSQQDFQKVISSRKKSASQSFVIFYLKRAEYPYARFGIAASKKIGGAVVRGRVRRQVRAMVDEVMKEQRIAPQEYVIVVRNPFLNRTYSANLEEMKTVFRKIGGKTNE